MISCDPKLSIALKEFFYYIDANGNVTGSFPDRSNNINIS